MAAGYRNFWNSMAYGQLTTKAPIPDARLGVGLAENMGFVPVEFYRDITNKETIKEPTPETTRQTPYEKLGITGQGDTVSLKDFTTDSFYLGEPMGGL